MEAEKNGTPYTIKENLNKINNENSLYRLLTPFHPYKPSGHGYEYIKKSPYRAE
jgi:hypothetical protein